MSYVYFIRGGDKVKIGTSRSPIGRLKSLSTGSPVALELIAVEYGDVKRERELHESFKSYRHSGEWFRYDGMLAFYIDTLPKIEPEPFPTRPEPPVKHAAPPPDYCGHCSVLSSSARIVTDRIDNGRYLGQGAATELLRTVLAIQEHKC